uniref:Uncharacterized protein n=1 Tax=Aegilops tauschii TaxID=37682 RepID=M8B7U4_AEGTA
MAACAERLGVPRGSGMFREALHAVAFFSEEKIADKVDYLKKTIRWSDTEVAIALSKAPVLLRKSKDLLRRRSEFLLSELGLEPAYIAHRPVILYYSLEGRLRPRHYVLKFLKETGLADRDWSFYNVVTRTEKDFVDKYICPHKEAAPHLAEDYATACKGQILRVIWEVGFAGTYHVHLQIRGHGPMQPAKMVLCEIKLLPPRRAFGLKLCSLFFFENYSSIYLIGILLLLLFISLRSLPAHKLQALIAIFILDLLSWELCTSYV